MAFGEDSWEKKDNGADMMWNPTATRFSNTGGGNNPIFGGKHYIYIFGHNADQTFPLTQPDGMGGELKDIPRYDEGKAMNKLLTAAAATYPGSASDNYRREMFIDAMWVNMPLLATG
ncbi:MAG: hypothetical protein H0W84_14320, partial [Bacteroidetes bacterium]|nr:hypothetical protein [Bacteroidota bacterium]